MNSRLIAVVGLWAGVVATTLAQTHSSVNWSQSAGTIKDKLMVMVVAILPYLMGVFVVWLGVETLLATIFMEPQKGRKRWAAGDRDIYKSMGGGDVKRGQREYEKWARSKGIR